jgi:hypothetical protein
VTDDPLFREVYGYHSKDDVPARTEEIIETKSGSRIFASECPFTGVACTKSTDTDEERGETRPLGVCSATSADGSPVVTCLERFKSAAVWRDLEQHLFPNTDGEFLVLEEGRLGDSGRIDLLPVVHREGEIVDFAAVEIQASYFSGSSIRGEFKTYTNRIDDGHPPEPPLGSRQMDYRSCVDKRLLPQLEEKVETMETWGRTFGAVLQSIAFGNSNIAGRVRRVPEDEATVLFFNYDYVESTPQYRLQLNEVFPTTLAEIDAAIGESAVPDEEAFVAYLRRKLSRSR